jgi:anti-sigma B factor antagonist
MHVETRKSGEIVILDLKGRLTAGLVDQLLRDGLVALLAEGWKRSLLDLSEVSFLDSAGLGELVAGLKTAKRFGAELKLLNVGEKVEATLYMSRLLPVFEIYASEAEALAHFGKA